MTFRSKGSLRTSILDLSHHRRRPRLPLCLYHLPFLPCPFLNSSMPCCPTPHPTVPRSAKAPITPTTLSDTAPLLSMSFADTLTLYSTNHSATVLMDETLYWSSSLSSANILTPPALCFRRPALFRRQRQTWPF